jgi:hypothetical protein
MPSGLRRINRKTWLTLRDAADRIGRELLRPAWSHRVLDRPRDDPLLDDVESDLYCAISSGEVTTLITRGGDPRVMAPTETQRLSFQIHLAKNWIEICDRGDFWAALLNAHELELFLKKYRATRFEETSRVERREKCCKWLCQEMKSGRKKRPKREYLNEAKRTFGVSEHDFDLSWSEADGITNSGWSKPGRPKSTQ